MEKGFDRAGFMAHLEDTFSGFENSFLRQLVENVLDYARDHEHVSKDQFCHFVSDMLPEITFGEVAAFCRDEILTCWGQQEKQRFQNRRRTTSGSGCVPTAKE